MIGRAELADAAPRTEVTWGGGAEWNDAPAARRRPRRSARTPARPGPHAGGGSGPPTRRHPVGEARRVAAGRPQERHPPADRDRRRQPGRTPGTSPTAPTPPRRSTRCWPSRSATGTWRRRRRPCRCGSPRRVTRRCTVPPPVSYGRGGTFRHRWAGNRFGRGLDGCLRRGSDVDDTAGFSVAAAQHDRAKQWLLDPGDPLFRVIGGTGGEAPPGRRLPARRWPRRCRTIRPTGRRRCAWSTWAAATPT